ncbi:hypothetical protein [Pseudomonas sp. NPDC089406]|uniref:DUF7716 domain-containing protein n=1 Tax=Pseudomonas sp. NPDC089406 TaxID=3364463 RepID=UPI00384B1BC8
MPEFTRISLREALTNVETLDGDHSLHLPQNIALWTADCLAIVEDPDAFEAYDAWDNPCEMAAIGYRYVLQCDDLKSISENLRETHPAPTYEQLFEAFIFYFENDAFI